jgi:DNA polymerase-3 subunit epsilon/ATP-dependent DNA helicase DinG
MPAPPRELVVVDTETTGLDPVRDRVVEIGAVRLDAGLRVVATWDSLVDSGSPLPLQIARLTGITAGDLAGAPPFADAYAALRSFLGDAIVLGQNVAFDLAMLGAAAARCGAPPPRPHAFDTLEAALLLLPELDRHGLASLALALDLGEPPHRALPDAMATAALLRELARRAAGLGDVERRLLTAAAWRPLELLDRLRVAPDDTPAAAVTVAADRRRGARHPPDQTAARTARATGGAGTAPAADDAEPAGPDARPTALPCRADGWRTAFAAGGALSATLEGFAVRPGQVELAGEVADLLDGGGLALFEAGTGMGKSLAYLLPAAFRAGASGTRVTVSTKTKALQRQLAERELPLVCSCLPDGFRWTLLMGRENYVCRRRLDEALESTGGDLFDRERLLALAWLAGRLSRGQVDVSALPYGATSALPALAETAHELRAHAAACLGGRCRARDGCLWRRARAAARAAHLVCVNHALLLAGGDALPPFDDLVIDEAHLLPDEAVSAFSERVDQAAIDTLLDEVRGRGGRRPLAAVARHVASGAPAEVAAALEGAAAGFERAVATLPGLADDLARALEALVAATAPPTDGEAAKLYGRTLLLTAGLQEQPLFDDVATVGSALGAALADLAHAAATATDALPDEHRERPRAVSVGAAAATAARLLDDAGRPPHADLVSWAEHARRPGRQAGRGTRGAAWSLNRAPLSPAPIVRERLWDRLRSGVLLSATLGVAGSFAYYRGEAGLAADLDVRERVFASPFDYRRQATLVLEHDPAARYDAAARPARLAAHLRRLTEITGGRLLALFTNRREVEDVAGRLGPHVEEEGVVLLAQGVHGGAAALAEEFRSHPATVLLGVDALWTGQDFPGDALVCLIIARLPFPRQDARFQARRRAAEQEGRDWFSSFYLPEAVLRFRQGFGRLIRTETDRGVVVVLDQRLTQKSYERRFLDSLPALDTVRAAPDELPAAVAAALARLGVAQRTPSGTARPG